jgi:transposase
MNFKPYDQRQGIFAPIIPADVLSIDDPAYLINDIIEALDLSKIYEQYSFEGNPAYHPKMLLKVLFFCYMKGIFSCRKINDGLTKYMMQLVFLSGGDTPCFSTINNFRKRHIAELPEIFAQIVLLCKELGMIGFEFLAIDGQKIHANASFKQSKREKDLNRELEKLELQMKSLIEKGEQIDIDKIERINILKKTYKVERRKAKVNIVLTKLKKLQEDEKDEKSKSEKRINVTDNDAPVMTHKDSTKKPSYETFAASDSKFQIITAYDCIADSCESKQAIPLIEASEKNLNESHKNIGLDAGFSSFENLVKMMAEMKSEVYMPDRLYDKWQKDGPEMGYNKSKFIYDEKNKSMKCPEGNPMELTREEDIGDYKKLLFKGMNCTECPKKEKCTKGNVRTVTIDSRSKLQDEMRNKLKTKEGKAIYQKRQITIEPVFGNIQKNMGWDQFLLRGKFKAKGEFGLIAIAHNLKKIVLHLNELGKDLKVALQSMKNKYSGSFQVTCA